MTIIVDSREKPRAIKKILARFESEDIQHHVSKLPVGDYMSLDNARLVIDRKQSLGELCGNVCQQHRRFAAELELAGKLGIKLIILCEHGGGIEKLEDVAGWVNPRLKDSPMAMSGERLYRVLLAMSKKYNAEFLFCDKDSTGRRIIELLGGELKPKS